MTLPNLLNCPPFPLLTVADKDWTATVVLPQWAGFQARRGWYNAVSSAAPSDGTTRLRVVGLGVDAPTPEQAAAYARILERGAEDRDDVLAAVFAEYPRFRAEYLDAFDDQDVGFADIAAGVPVLTHPDQLRTLMGLGTVSVLPESRDRVAYVGYEFGCEWEGHGLGALTHKGRVIEIGQAPTAFDGRAAAADADASRG